MTRSKLHLNLFVPNTGHHEGSWRHPDAYPDRVTDVTYYQEAAAIAERGKFDALFLGDTPSIMRHIEYIAHGRQEPLTLLSALATTTTHIGLIATVSTSYYEPYNLARQLSSLDHISAGRAGWNVVTSWSPSAARNFGGRERAVHTERYARAEDFLEVALKLWDSWDDDARVIDRAAGIFADARRIHEIDHEGPVFSVRGPLNLPRSPQGRPVLVQAGSSSEGRAFAARYADAVFTAQNALDDAVEFANDIRARVRTAGRRPEDVRVLPGLSAIIGSTEAEARAREEELANLTVPQAGLNMLSAWFDGVDFSQYDLDAAVPVELLPDPNSIQGAQSRSRVVYEMLRRKPDLSLRALLRQLSAGRGHLVVVGTPEQVSATMLDWQRAGAADGFNVMPPYLHGSLVDFVDQVVPLLQQAGVFRREYDGSTLRDHYGLERPVSRYASVGV